MIKSIRLTNFYSFKETTINLNNDLNILIGINGSGKSNFFKAIEFLYEGVVGKGLQKLIIDKWCGVEEIFFKGEKKSNQNNIIELEFVFDANWLKPFGYSNKNDIIYKIKLIKISGLINYYVNESIYSPKDKIIYSVLNGKAQFYNYDFKPGINFPKPAIIELDNLNPQELALSKIFNIENHKELNILRNAIAEIAVYNFFNTKYDSPIRRSMKATSGRRLMSEGDNMPQILNTLNINHKKEYQKIVELLNDVNENFRGFNFHYFGSGNFELMLDEFGLDSAIHVTSISDGTLRYLCLLSILYNPERGKFICIDEPEVGLHPDMALNITNAIKEASVIIIKA